MFGPILGPYLRPSESLSLTFRIAAATRAVLFFVSSGVTEVGIASGFGGGSSNTGSGPGCTLGSQLSLSGISRNNCLTYVSHGDGGSADTFPQNTLTPNSPVIRLYDCWTAGCAMR